MDVQGEFTLPAAPALVWQRLNDPEVLVHCIPGCARMTRLDAHNFECEIRVSYGFIKATFLTLLELSNIRPAQSYTLTGRSQGGLAGFGEGVADVCLVATAQGTTLRYATRLSASGHVAQLGSRLLSSTARHMTEKFFAAFAASFVDGK